MVLWKDKIDKPLARLTKKKSERTQINKINNEIGRNSNNTTEILKKIIREYNKQLYANKLGNLEEMHKILETCSLPKWLKKKQIIWKEITRSEIESVIKENPCKQKSRTRWLHWGILPNIQIRTYAYPSQTIPRNWRGGSTPKFIL